MKRTLLLVVSVLVAAVGTGVVALWATSTAAGHDRRSQAAQAAAAAAGTAAAPSARPTSTAAPTAVVSGHKGLAVTIANPGLTPGQWIDVAVTAEGEPAALLYTHIAVLSVLADGRVLLGLTREQAVDLLTRTSTGQALTALLPAPDDPVPAAEPAGSKGSRRTPLPTTAAASARPTGQSTGQSTRQSTGQPSAPPSVQGSPTVSEQASSSP